MTNTDKLQIRYVNMYEDRGIPLSGLIRIGNSDEIFFLFHPSSEAYVAKYTKGEKFDFKEFRESRKMLYPINTLLGLKIWLVDIIESEEGDIFEFNGKADWDGISVRYTKIDNETGKIHIEFDDDMPREGFPGDPFYSDKPLDGTVSKFELVNLIYGGLVDFITDNFNGKERFEDVYGISEPIYETFFSYDIDKYLKENGVDDIDERVRNAKNKIREEWNNLFDECDREYKGNHDPYWHTFDHLI